MPLINFLDLMDLDEPQKVLLKDVIVRSCLTTASFKLMSDEQLQIVGFPLPAILELKALINSELPSPLANISVNRNTSSPALSTPTTSLNTSLLTSEMDELTSEKLKELSTHIHVKSSNGLKQLTRLLVDEMIKRMPGYEVLEKLKPSTDMKIRYARLAIEAYPELTSVDQNCPHAVFFKPYFVEHLAGGVIRKHTPTGTIEENLKSRRTEAKLRANRQFEGSGSQVRAKRSRKEKVKNAEQPADLAPLMRMFTEPDVSSSELRKKTLTDRQKFLSEKGAINYSDYLYCIELDIRIFEKLDEEFRLWAPTASNESFARLFLPFVDKILNSVQNPPKESRDKIADLRAMQLPASETALRSLPLLAPAKLLAGVKNRPTVVEAIHQSRGNFIIDITDVTNIETEARKLETGAILKSSSQCFVVSPIGVIEARDLFHAIDVGMRLFYVLNRKFPDATFVVWSFLQIMVFKLPSTKVPCQVDAMARSLRDDVQAENQ